MYYAKSSNAGYRLLMHWKQRSALSDMVDIQRRSINAVEAIDLA
jgi:hypothetical protein